MTFPEYLRTEEAAPLLKLHRKTLRRLASRRSRKQSDGSCRAVLGDGWVAVKQPGSRTWLFRREEQPS